MLFSATMFTGAGPLFLMQPMFAKLALLLAFHLGARFDPKLFPALVQDSEVTGETIVHINQAFLPQIRRPAADEPRHTRIGDPPSAKSRRVSHDRDDPAADRERTAAAAGDGSMTPDQTRLKRTARRDRAHVARANAGSVKCIETDPGP